MVKLFWFRTGIETTTSIKCPAIVVSQKLFYYIEMCSQLGYKLV